MAANYPFLSLATGESRQFKIDKLSLKENGYPFQPTLQLIDKYYARVFKPLISEIKNGVLIKVPSGSGSNRIVDLLAKRLATDAGAVILPDHALLKAHTGEAKNRLDPNKRITNPIKFLPNAQFDFKTYHSKRAFVLDDVLSTGESTVRTAQALEAAGLNVHGIAALVTVERYHPRERDLQRVAEKLKTVSEDSIESIHKKLDKVFAPYTRQRLNRFERSLRNVFQLEKGIGTLHGLFSVELQIEKELKMLKNNVSEIKRFR